MSETGHSTSILIDAGSMWINLVTRKFFIQVADGPGNYNSCLLRFKIMTLTFHTDTGEGPSPRGVQGALNPAQTT